MLNRLAILAVLLVILAVIRIVSTYSTFNHTFDEVHFAAGLEYIDGQYTFDPQHPPLARIVLATGPYLAGLRTAHQPNIWHEANTLLAPDYWRNLALARLGVLPFFVLACLVLWLWTADLFGDSAALAAAGLFSLLPPVLAHSGLATLDMAATATVFLAAWVWYRWLRSPSIAMGVWLGIAIGIAVLCKFSALLFLPPVFLAVWISGRQRLTDAHVLSSIGAVVACLTAVTLVYRGELWSFYQGVAYVWQHNSGGHASWLLGEYRSDGWWYFFPVVLAVKTPLAFSLLALLGAGMTVKLRRPDPARTAAGYGGLPVSRVPVLCAIAILLVCLPARINLGVRHILIVYPFLAMLAGWGLVALFRHRRLIWRAAGAYLAACLFVTSLRAAPDYLAYFNELAPRPEYVLAESDLDWGQDLQRLSLKLKELKVDHVWLDYFGSADVSRFGFAYNVLPPWQPVKGWVAVSIHSQTINSARLLKQAREQLGVAGLPTKDIPAPLQWLDSYRPVAMAGKSIKIYNID